jgi:hypothetical protein
MPPTRTQWPRVDVLVHMARTCDTPENVTPFPCTNASVTSHAGHRTMRPVRLRV